MKFKQKMLILCCIPLLMLTGLSLIIGLIQFRSGMYKQTQSSLKSGALAAMNLYNSQGYGDYDMKSDGNVWRGMNFNVSEKTSVVDDLKEQIGIDITFFYHDTAVMTSICNESGIRWIGMRAGENICKYTLEQGAQLWYHNIEIDGKMCHAYIIPIVQPSNGTIVGALMASISTNEMDSIMKNYIITGTLASTIILIMAIIFIFWYLGSLTKVIHDVRKVLLNVSQGNLSDNRLTNTKRKDEFGELALGTEKLRNKIGNLLNDIRDEINKLTNAAGKLNDMSKTNVQASREMSDSVGLINSKANSQKVATQNATYNVDITRNAIDLMLEHLDDINLLSNNIANLSNNSEAILDELLKSSKNSREATQEISIQVAVTNEAVQQIRSVTEYITNIAEETNLLALNASIEAARAGEAGKGFAVVAQEIQKLAEESNNSATNIDKNIQSLIKKIDGIVKIMDTIENALKYQEDNIEKTKQIFDEMNNDINQITEKESEMQENISGINQAKDNMSTIISDLSKSAIDNANLSENATEVTKQMMLGIENLEILTTDLTEVANRLDENLHSFLS